MSVVADFRCMCSGLPESVADTEFHAHSSLELTNQGYHSGKGRGDGLK